MPIVSRSQQRIQWTQFPNYNPVFKLTNILDSTSNLSKVGCWWSLKWDDARYSNWPSENMIWDGITLSMPQLAALSLFPREPICLSHYFLPPSLNITLFCPTWNWRWFLQDSSPLWTVKLSCQQPLLISQSTCDQSSFPPHFAPFSKRRSLPSPPPAYWEPDKPIFEIQ